MRLFLKQENIIETTPILDHITKAPRTDLDVFFKLYDMNDALVAGSDVTLAHAGGGVYRVILPELNILTGKYQVQLTVSLTGVHLWYFKGPVKALIRAKFDV